MSFAHGTIKLFHLRNNHNERLDLHGAAIFAGDLLACTGFVHADNLQKHPAIGERLSRCSLDRCVDDLVDPLFDEEGSDLVISVAELLALERGPDSLAVAPEHLSKFSPTQRKGVVYNWRERVVLFRG